MEHDPQAHEEIHLPAPSIAPIIVAAGITMTLVGVLSLSLFVVGVVTLAGGIALWSFSRG